MKLSDKTLGFLKNIQNINPSIHILPGNVIRTMGPDKEIMMRVEIEEEFDKAVRIYDLQRLLGAIGMFNDPELTLHDDYMTVKSSGGGGEIKYMYAAEEASPKALTKDLPMPSDLTVEFTLTQENLKSIMKAAQILGVEDISVLGNNGKLQLVAHNKSVKSTDNFSIDLGETDKEFSLDFKAEKLKLIPSEYNVKISPKLISHFRSDSLNLDYWVGLEYSSSVGE